MGNIAIFILMFILGIIVGVAILLVSLFIKKKKEESAALSVIDKAKKAMEENNIEEIKSSKDKLAEKAMALSSRVYEEAAKAQQAQTESNTEQTTSESKGKDDNIKEANFEEK